MSDEVVRWILEAPDAEARLTAYLARQREEVLSERRDAVQHLRARVTELLALSRGSQKHGGQRDMVKQAEALGSAASALERGEHRR